MIRPSSAIVDAPTAPHAMAAHTYPTVWGLSPVELHDRFWASRGIQVVRPGEDAELVDDAELFLLTDHHWLTLFRLGRLADQLSWIKPDLVWLRLHDSREHVYRENAITDSEGRFLRFERQYEQEGARVIRFALTPNREVARAFQRCAHAREGWRRLRHVVAPAHRHALSVSGMAFDRRDDHDLMDYLRDLMKQWKRPDATIERLQKVSEGVWADRDADVDANAKFVGPTWIGAGRQIDDESCVLGPAVLWDDPDKKPAAESLRWRNIEPVESRAAAVNVVGKVRWRRLSGFDRFAKRTFDICFSLLVIACSLWLYPFIMLAIWLEDGRPFFFVHWRETRGGKEFPCLKFRSMKNDAEDIKKQLMQNNQADGPQFFIENDPRMTRIGKFMRDTQIDELPQFFNVLVGHMSIVGPRPSPRKENQYCPPWREARLSVKPGLTGLWQVKRTREPGLDFQEWIKFDIEYVENHSFALDMEIIWETIKIVLRFGR